MPIVYKHIRLDTNEVFYVGIGQTEKRAYSKNYRNKYWHNIVNKCGYKIELIHENLNWQEVQDKERELIRQYGRLDLKTGCLVNMTDGGEGATGYKHTEEWKLANSKRNKNKIISEKQKNIVKNYMTNRIITTEFKDKVSKGVIKYFDEKGRKQKKETHNTKELIWINKDKINKRVFNGYLNNYIKDGWSIGRFIESVVSDLMSKKGSKWMNNGVDEAMILNNEINYYLSLNWIYGRTKKIDMPYTHKKVGNKNCVYKKDGGAKVGCTKGDVHKYLAALHANANESVEINEVRKIVRKTLLDLKENLDNNKSDYKKWKRKNVTLRGVATNPGEYNGAGSITLGDGFYTASLGNKEMARKYGKVYFVVNGRPKHPLVFNNTNESEIWFQRNLYFKNFKDVRDFNAHTSIEAEVQKMGYDGIEIKGREIVNFKPENVKYFKTEAELFDYYENFIKNSSGEESINEDDNLNDNFQKWFAGSKVVDKSGNPIPVHHGTAKKFSKFNFKNAGQQIIWFTSNKASVEAGEVGAQGSGHIMDLYASIKNPAGWEEYNKYGLGQLESMGYDGAILPDSDGTFTGFVFEPTQLKSVKNKGEWNPGDKNIYKEDERKLGRRLSDQTKNLYVVIYRAAPMSANEFFDKDYVTLSKKFAIEHAENNHIYHEEPYHVIQALVSTKDVYDAFNPGEYFYSGPNKKAKEIYVSKGPDEYEGWDDSLNEAYGGPGEFNLPATHKAGMKVPKGGSSCASCKFLGKDGKSCGNQFWVEWNGGDSKLPAPADEYCSDWYEKKESGLEESKNKTKNITDVIKFFVNQYTKEHTCTAWDINNGMCSDFANDVISVIGDNEGYELTDDMFFNVRDIEFAKEHWGSIIETKYGVWGKDMLDRYGYPPVPLENIKGEASHAWIFYKGKHYDAELPEGTDKWYELPLMKKWLLKFK